MSESPCVFIFCSPLSLFICPFFFSRLYGDTCIHGSTDLFRPSLTFPCSYSVLSHFFFMSCSHLISLLRFNLLWDTIFRTATPCTHQIWCGQHDCVCDIVRFDLHQHFGPLFTTMICEQTLYPDALRGCLRISLRGYLPNTDPMITL